MQGSQEALQAIEKVLCRPGSEEQDEPDEQPAGGNPPPPPHGHEGPWHPHEAHPWMHHMMMMKGKGFKGKGCWKGKAKGWLQHGWDHHHGPEFHAHHKGKGRHGGHCHGRGGPAHKIAQALGIDKHEAWHLIELAAGGDAAAQEKIAAAFTDADQAKQLDAAWLEAKLAKKAEKMACKSELLEAKAAWFASSAIKKHQVKAAKLQKKAAAVQSKGDHFHNLAAGFKVQETNQGNEDPVAVQAATPAPAPVENTVGQGGSTDFIETFMVVDPNVESNDQQEVDVNDQVDALAVEVEANDQEDDANDQVDGLVVEVPSTPSEWTDALQSMTMMGFESAQAAQALQDHNGNIQLAVSQLIAAPTLQ